MYVFQSGLRDKNDKKSSSHLEQPAGLHGPDEDLEHILASSTHDLPAVVHRQAGELYGARRRECAEVTVPGGGERQYMVRPT